MVIEKVYVSNVITNYSLVESLFTDILFQHGVDKIYFYGVTGNRKPFVEYIPVKNDKTFGFPVDRPELYEPLQMIEIGSKVNAHVDMDYIRYRRHLDEMYEWADNDEERSIVSRVIGMFEPNETVSVPILDVMAFKVEITKKTLSEKISDIESLYKFLYDTKSYKKYRTLMYSMGTFSKLTELKDNAREMDESLKDVIAVADELFKPIGVTLKITKALAYMLINRQERKFNPLLLNLEPFRTKAALKALSQLRLSWK